MERVAGQEFFWPEPPRTFALHPGPAGGVAVAWICPIDGKVTITGRFADADATGGDGVAWKLEQFTGAWREPPFARGDDRLLIEAECRIERANHLHVADAPVRLDDAFEQDRALHLGAHRVRRVLRTFFVEHARQGHAVAGTIDAASGATTARPTAPGPSVSTAAAGRPRIIRRSNPNRITSVGGAGRNAQREPSHHQPAQPAIPPSVVASAFTPSLFSHGNPPRGTLRVPQ